MADTDTTIDYISLGIIALAIGFIVYEVSQTIQSTESVLGGYLGPILIIGGVLGIVVAVAVLL